MQRVDKQDYKRQVIRTLKKVGKPIWLSDLHREYGLPYATIHGSKKKPASMGLRELININAVVQLRPRYCKVGSKRPRVKIALPNKSNPRRYFELDLLERIEKLENEVERLKKPWYKKLLT